MGLFGLGKKEKVLDLTEGYKQQQARANAQSQSSNLQSQSSSSQDSLNFLGNLASSSASSGNGDEVLNLSDPEEKKRKLAKHLGELTNKIEEISNQIYHLQQRVEVLERKAGVKGFE